MSRLKKYSDGVLQMGSTKLYSPDYREETAVGIRRANSEGSTEKVDTEQIN